jgi:spore coat polysaccharide biosynthesis protein SpsF
MLEHLVMRLNSVPSIDQVVIATTINDADIPIIEFADKIGIPVFRGSENDVMGRVIGAAEASNADIIVEITGDCPIIDPDIVEQTIQMFLYNSAVYVSNAHVRSYPDGMDTQVFPLDSLKLSASMTTDPLDREHVSRYIRNHPEIFPHLHLIAPPSLYWPELGVTLDEYNDYVLLKKIIESLGSATALFSCLDIISLLQQNPDWIEINRQVVRKGET